MTVRTIVSKKGLAPSIGRAVPETDREVLGERQVHAHKDLKLLPGRIRAESHVIVVATAFRVHGFPRSAQHPLGAF